MEYCDPDTGLACKAWVLVACLPWSQCTFAEAFPDMGEESWITAHVHAFSFFGGSAPILVPDNCKTGVVRNTVDELVVNGRYRRIAEHYGCAVVPARPGRPRGKGQYPTNPEHMPDAHRDYTAAAHADGDFRARMCELWLFGAGEAE